MTARQTVSREEWLKARRALLEQEKIQTKQRDEIAKARRALPWVLVENDYVFDTEKGPVTLDALFKECSQLIVYHFMFGPDWQQGCVSCSFWADTFNGLAPHLAARDIGFTVVSSAPISKIGSFKQRMGWEFDWVSSAPSTFNTDFNVGFAADQQDGTPLMYNFQEIDSAPMDEMHGTSVFAKGDDGAIYHTYSTYGRGLDITNAAYSYIDLTPNGRNENPQGNAMSWVRHHDNY